DFRLARDPDSPRAGNRDSRLTLQTVGRERRRSQRTSDREGRDDPRVGRSFQECAAQRESEWRTVCRMWTKSRTLRTSPISATCESISISSLLTALARSKRSSLRNSSQAELAPGLGCWSRALASGLARKNRSLRSSPSTSASLVTVASEGRRLL